MPPKHLISALRNISPKSVWGCRETFNNSSLQCFADNEYVATVGSRMIAFDINASHDKLTTLVDAYDNEVLFVSSMALSPDCKYLATLVKMNDSDGTNNNKATFLIYNLESRFQGHSRPRVLCFLNESEGHPHHIRNIKKAESTQIEVTCMAFSHDSYFFACGTDIKSSGVVIFDHFRGTVYQKISIESTVRHITFNPGNNLKLCTTGDLGLFKFWRFSEKSIHAAPVNGLKVGDFSYSYHTWIDESGVVIGGTNTGFVSIVQGCEQKGSVQYAFGNTSLLEENAVSEHSISNILVRGDIVCVVSVTNLFAVYEVRRGAPTEKDKPGPFSSISLLTRILLPNVEFILGLQWSVRDSITSYLMMGMSSSSIFQFELITETEIAVFSAGSSTKKSDVAPVTPTIVGRNLSKSKWLEITGEKTIFTYHSGCINAISLACRNHSVITSSFEDATVRVWDYSDLSNFNSSFLVEKFTGSNAADNPFHIDMHPSGLCVAFACENEVKEFAVTDSSLDLMKKTSTKTSFVGPTGIPFNITQPVSLVKYSNGGQYLAVVTGKVAQVFHCYSKSFATGSMSGESSRIMILCDHIAPITDLTFLKDDSQIVTSASDGSVYSWKVGAVTRDSEFVCKGVPATLVAVSKSSLTGSTKDCTIVACFEHNYEISSIAAMAVFKKKESGKWLRKMNQGAVGADSIGGDDVAEIMTVHNSTLLGSSKHSSGSFGSFRRSSSILASAGAEITAALENSVESSVNTPMKGKSTNVGLSFMATIPEDKTNLNGKKQQGQFLAVWANGKVTPTPHIIQMAVPVRSIAMGETDGPDRIPICMLGLQDGRVLISQLPFPVRMIESVAIALSPNPRSSQFLDPANLNSATGRMSNSGKRTSSRQKDKGLSTHSFMSSHDSSSVFSESSRSTHLSSPSLKGPSTSHRNSPGKPSQTMLVIPEGDADDAVSSRNGNLSPTPGKNVVANNSTTTTSTVVDALDEELCKEFRVHVGAVMQVGISSDGMWLFSAGSDGVFYMYACSRRGKELSAIPQTNDVAEDRFLMIDRSKIQLLRANLKETELALEILKKDNEISITRITSTKDKIISDLEEKMRKDVKERDEIIVKERSELQALKHQKRDELDRLKNQCEGEINRLEVEYERKLTHEALYLEKMRQAYDEYVVHSRLDLQEVQLKNDKRLQDVENEKAMALREAEKQKGMLLQYFDYIKLRNNEVLNGLEEKQEDERFRLKSELKTAHKALDDVYTQNLTDQAKFNRKTQNLMMEIESKDLEVLKQKNEILWANERISKLETALQKATQDLKLREEMSEKWESKTGELQQKIIDLERIRKALTTQLHTLRQELGPKEENLVKVSEKLQEMDREYEMSLHAISEKDSALTQKSMSLHLLQKQIRELRMTAARKDSIIRRAATIFEDYRLARQQAYFCSEKRTVPTNHPSFAIANGTANGSGAAVSSSSTAAAVIQEIDENGQVMKEKNIVNKGNKKATVGSAKVARAGQPAASSSESAGGVIEIIAQNEEMKAAFKRLTDMLAPYLKEDHADTEIQDNIEAVRSEQERHMKQLHNTVSRVRSSLDLVNVVSEKKIYNYMSDNQTLLAEVNNLRSEVRNLSMENQRLMAQMEFSASIKGSKKPSRVGSDGEEEMSINESLSSTSEVEFEKTRGQLIREKSKRKRMSVSRHKLSRENSRRGHSEENSESLKSYISRSTPEDLSQNPAAGQVSAWDAALPSNASNSGPSSRIPSPSMSASRPPFSLTVIPSMKPFSNSTSNNNSNSKQDDLSGLGDRLSYPMDHLLRADSPNIASNQQKLNEHMKKYANFSKEKDAGQGKLTADQKIAALIAMNEKEIQSLQSSTAKVPQVTDSKKNSLASNSTSMPKLGTAVIELPKVFKKKV